jgi:hypothetical protein
MATVDITGEQDIDYATLGMACRAARGGTFENSVLSPSAIVGCAKAALARLEYEMPANIAVCTAVMTSPAAAPIIVKPTPRPTSG